jgi:hypothetical protein
MTAQGRRKLSLVASGGNQRGATHEMSSGAGELDPVVFGGDEPVARITIERMG